MCAEILEVPSRQLFCRGDSCGVMFFICRSCYRGHAYCSDECRREARRIQRRNANQRYEQDAGVREDRRNRQRELRERQRAGRVTDQSSNSGYDRSSMGAPLAEAADSTPPAERKPPQDLPRPAWDRGVRRIVCVICGRVGRFIAAFARRE